MYNKFGKNAEDFILLVAVISNSDTKQSMISAYQTKAKITPVFPIVLYSQGGKKLADLFGMSNYGGVQWMCHPKLEYDQIADYQEATITTAVNTALADNCVGTYIFLDEPVKDNNIQIYHNQIILSTLKAEKASIRLISLNGQVVFSTEKILINGINRIELDKMGTVKGVFILDIKGASSLQYRNKITFN